MMPSMQATRRGGHWRAVYGLGSHQPPPLLVPAPLTQQPDAAASRRVIWHRRTTDPDASAHEIPDVPDSGWYGPVTVDGLWTCSAPHDDEHGRRVVRVLPEWQHYAALRGQPVTPVTVPAAELWVMTSVPDTQDWEGIEGAFGVDDPRTDRRVTDPRRPATRRLRFARNTDELAGARAVTVHWDDDGEPTVRFGWRVASEPYALETTMPNLEARSVEEMDRPYTLALVRLCAEADWYASLATGRPLGPAELVPTPLHHVFLE